MAFELEASEDIAKEIESVATSEIEDAISLLADDSEEVDTRIHETRKHLKKLRALLQLIRPMLAHSAFERTNAALRQIGKRLAPARDAAAQLESWDELIAKPKVLPDSLQETVRQKLVEQRESAISSEALSDAIAASLFELRQLLECVSVFRPERRGWRVLGAGLRRTYKRGRRSLADVQRNFSDERLHGFRRFVKQHQYQTQLLEPAWQGVINAHRSAVSDLGELLGQHHDLSVIEQTLEEYERDFDPETRARMAAATHDRKTKLVEEAFALAERIYAESPRDLEARLATYYAAWLKEQRGSAKA